ncbi:MAG: DUF2085 domain-containing protein [Theionarchaea archaeon]|nr:DUF2085 domain-containing protein [Theionarchaea archaeon]
MKEEGKTIRYEKDDVVIGEGIWRVFEHNKKSHSIQTIWGGKAHYLCARCTGTYIGIALFSVFSIFLLLSGNPFHISGNIAFGCAWLMAIPAVVDWSTSKTNLRSTNNMIRCITGFSLGIGIVIYFWIGWSLTYTVIFLFLNRAFVMLPVGIVYLTREGWSLSDIVRCQKRIALGMFRMWVKQLKQISHPKSPEKENTRDLKHFNVAKIPPVSVTSSNDDCNWCGLCLCLALFCCVCSKAGFTCAGCL